VADPGLPQKVASGTTHNFVLAVVAVIGIVSLALLCCVVGRCAFFGVVVPSECPEEPPRNDAIAHARWREECTEQQRRARARGSLEQGPALLNPNQLKVTLGLQGGSKRRVSTVEDQRLLA
jgi:hypothetical protein